MSLRIRAAYFGAVSAMIEEKETSRSKLNKDKNLMRFIQPMMLVSSD